jgi:molecular chaperone GrpE
MNDDVTPAADEDKAADADAASAAGADLGSHAGQDAEALRAEVAQLKEQVLRYAADAENTRRRAEREANDARAYAIQKFARDLLGVADNLSRALEHAPRESDDPQVKNLAIGLDMTEKALQSAFERNGLKKLEPARGTKFDPHQHQAMMEQPAPDQAPGTVVQVLQAGYDLFGRNVRPAMVVVSAKGPAAETPAETPATNPYAHADSEDDAAGAAVDRKA